MLRSSSAWWLASFPGEEGEASGARALERLLLLQNREAARVFAVKRLKGASRWKRRPTRKLCERELCLRRLAKGAFQRRAFDAPRSVEAVARSVGSVSESGSPFFELPQQTALARRVSTFASCDDLPRRELFLAPLRVGRWARR